MNLGDYSCVLCNSGCEAFSQSCWNTIPITWNLNFQPLDMIIEASKNFGSPLFREIFITAYWVIWTTRYGVIFYNNQINLNVWNTQFSEELGQLCIKAKKSRQASLFLWRGSIENVCLFFSFGSSCLVLLCCTFVNIVPTLTEKKKIGRDSPAGSVKKTFLLTGTISS